MKRAFLLLVATLCISFSSWSQVTYEKRIEVELKDGYTDEEIFEFGESGFIISSRNENDINDETEWKFEKFNSSLNSVYEKKLLLNKKLKVDETFRNEKRIHTLYRDRKEDYSIVSIEASKMEITQIDGKLPKKSVVYGMAILNDYALLEAELKRAPFLLSINWKVGGQKLIPIVIDNINPKKTSIMGLQVLEEANEIFVFVKAYVERGKTDIYVVRLNDKGEKEEVYNLTKNIEENIINISASKLKENKYVFTGTYSTKYTGMSEGLLFCQAENNSIDFIKFYNFLDLENFLSYLPEKRQERIEKKKEKKEEKGKDFSINYRIAAHGLIQLDDGYLFLGEAYYPTYRTETYTTTTTNNGVTTTQTHTRQVFDGYQYTHAMLGKFDKNGELLWDEIFEMWSAYKPFYVKRFISIAERNQNSIKLVFASRNKITSKSIDFNGSVIQDSQSEEIETNFEDDKVKRSFSNIDYWYDNYFIAYGLQKIKNLDENANSKKKRKVYFISKIKF